MSNEWDSQGFMLPQHTNYHAYHYDAHPPSSSQTTFEPLPQTPNFTAYASMAPPQSPYSTQPSPLHHGGSLMMYGPSSTSSSSAGAAAHSSSAQAVPRRAGLTMTQSYVQPHQIVVSSLHQSPIASTTSSSAANYPNTHPPAHTTVPLPLSQYGYHANGGDGMDGFGGGSSSASDSSPDLHNGHAGLGGHKKRKSESSMAANPEWPWGMPPDEYQKLDSAKKKQVRNRVGAAKFRKKRNAKIDALDMGYRRLLQDRVRLSAHVRDLEKRLADYCLRSGDAPPAPLDIEPEQAMPQVFPTPLPGQNGFSPTQGLGLEFTPGHMSLSLSHDLTEDSDNA